MGSGTVPKFEDIVEKIYAAVDERILWNDVAGDIAHAAGAVSCSLQVRSGGKAKIVGASGYKEFNPKLYEQEYAKQDVRAQVLMGLPADEVHPFVGRQVRPDEIELCAIAIEHGSVSHEHDQHDIVFRRAPPQAGQRGTNVLARALADLPLCGLAQHDDAILRVAELVRQRLDERAPPVLVLLGVLRTAGRAGHDEGVTLGGRCRRRGCRDHDNDRHEDAKSTKNS